MKTSVLLLSVLFTLGIFAQDTKQGETSKRQVEINSQESDSLEYELLITEIGFETYLMTQPSMNFYTKDYYKNWNYRYVIEYNHRYFSGPRRDIYENEINYDNHIDYGLELEYQLYYYFRFFEKKYGISLIDRGR